MIPENWKLITKKKIDQYLDEQFGIKSPDSWRFLVSGKSRIWIHKPDRKLEQDLSQFKCIRVGLYFGSLDLGGLRLSVEGSQLIGQIAKRNIVTLKTEDAMKWFQGKDLQLKDDFSRFSGFVIIKTDNGIAGCGYTTKSKILNFLPKTRRLSKRIGKKRA